MERWNNLMYIRKETFQNVSQKVFTVFLQFQRFYFFIYFSYLIIVVLAVQCDIYKSAYNISV
jgi:hypothetical protein